MENAIVTMNSVKQYDKFAVVGFLLGLVSVIFNPISAILILDSLNFFVRSYIEEIFFILSFTIPLVTIILTIIGIIRIELNIGRKGFGLAASGLILALVVLIPYLVFALTYVPFAGIM